MAKIKLGENATGVKSIPVSVPVIKEPADDFSAINVVQYVANNPDDGVVVTDEQLAIMRSNTDIVAKVAAGLLVIEEEEEEE